MPSHWPKKFMPMLCSLTNGTVLVARRMGLSVTGTLGVLDLAAQQQLVDLGQAIAALRQTSFRGPEDLIDEMLRRDILRRSSSGN